MVVVVVVVWFCCCCCCCLVSILFLLLFLLLSEAVDDEERVEQEGQAHGQHGVHDPVKLNRFVPVPFQPVQNFDLVEKVVC